MRKVMSSPVFWGCCFIVLGFFPILSAHIIIGCLMSSIPVSIILLARRAGIPRSEWLVISLIVLLFFSFFLLLSEKLIYPIVISGIGFIISSFSFEKADSIKDKLSLEEHIDPDKSMIYGEILPSMSQKRTDVAMRFYRDKQYLGAAHPVARYGYHFTFYGTGEKCSNLYLSKREWKCPWIYPVNTYKLDETDINLLIIRHVSRRKIQIELYHGDSLIIPLYKRKAELSSEYGMNVKFCLYTDGFIVTYDRTTEAQMDVSIACFTYFMWLIVFGSYRTDY